jgi:hypothetical protein
MLAGKKTELKQQEQKMERIKIKWIKINKIIREIGKREWLNNCDFPEEQMTGQNV